VILLALLYWPFSNLIEYLGSVNVQQENDEAEAASSNEVPVNNSQPASFWNSASSRGIALQNFMPLLTLVVVIYKADRMFDLSNGQWSTICKQCMVHLAVSVVNYFNDWRSFSAKVDEKQQQPVGIVALFFKCLQGACLFSLFLVMVQAFMGLFQSF